MSLMKPEDWKKPFYQGLEPDSCFYCGAPVHKGETLILWMTQAGFRFWHPSCGEKWLLAFARDVWECKQQGLLPEAPPK